MILDSHQGTNGQEHSSCYLNRKAAEEVLPLRAQNWVGKNPPRSVFFCSL